MSTRKSTRIAVRPSLSESTETAAENRRHEYSWFVAAEALEEAGRIARTIALSYAAGTEPGERYLAECIAPHLVASAAARVAEAAGPTLLDARGVAEVAAFVLRDWEV